MRISDWSSDVCSSDLFLNVPRIKGTHTAMKSGMMAAEAAFAAVAAGRAGDMLDAYQAAYDESWVKKELSVVRNVLPLVEKYGDLAGTILSGITMWLETLKIKVPFTMKHHPVNMTLYRDRKSTRAHV